MMKSASPWSGWYRGGGSKDLGSKSSKASVGSPLDVLAPHLDIVFCGINPGMKAAACGHNFTGHSNRFWKVLHLAGFTPHQIPAEQDRTLLYYGFGLTTAVDRPTRGAAELSRAELTGAGEALEAKITAHSPRVLAFLGKAAYSAIIGRRDVKWGPQKEKFGGAQVWVIPNPSGLNRSFSLNDLVLAYRDLRLATSIATSKTLNPTTARLRKS
jgi:double-stranded uracil-DNA glycosylase